MARHILTEGDLTWIFDGVYFPLAHGPQENGATKHLLCSWHPKNDTYIVRFAGEERTFDNLTEAIEFYNTL